MNGVLQWFASYTPNWFDFLVVVLVIYGMVHGRSKGMSQIMLSLCQWLVIVVLASFVYKPIGEMLSVNTGIQLLYTYLFAYLWVVVFINLLFAYIHKRTKGQLVSVDFFGSMEYYFGMVGGAVKMLCIVLVAMALFHARHYSAAELHRNQAFQQEYFGAIRFPTLGELHQDVFQDSMAGHFAKEYLSRQLIVPTRMGQTQPDRTASQQYDENRAPSSMMGIGQNY